MDTDLVRTVRTCQPIAICETTIRAGRGQISPMDSDHDIARRLIALRERLELKQSEFADILHIAKNTLNGFERGKRSLTIETARRIHERYGVSVDWLLFGRIGQPRQELAEELGSKPAIAADKKVGKQAPRRRKAA